MPSLCRCAIYTRQSREASGDYSSCEAQFDACAKFIVSQIHLGWTYTGLRYDDQGHSGESLERPGLTRLLVDIRADRIDRLIVHRLDRLSRKVSHCASLLAELNKHGVALTIVTSPELGATAGGALMLNLFSSFAEFERELIRDRLADARTALKRRGRRVAGVVPYGYTTDPVTKQLVPTPMEARRVQAIFERAAKVKRRVKSPTMQIAMAGVLSVAFHAAAAKPAAAIAGRHARYWPRSQIPFILAKSGWGRKL